MEVHWNAGASDYQTTTRTLAVRDGDADALVTLAKAAFGETFPEEEDPGIGDVTKMTLTVRAGAEAHEKTFLGSWPPALSEFRERQLAATRRCRNEGFPADERP